MAALVLWLTSLAAETARATAPVQTKFPFSQVVKDQGEHCGSPIRWEISGTFHLWQFFDQDGNLTRLHAHVAENNVLTNLDSGMTVTDKPTFNQTAIVNPDDGTFESIETNGLFVNARGKRVRA